MKEIHLNTLILFVTRTSMYVGEVSKESIIAFIHGYELGTEGKCSISNSISELLSKEFKIEKMATGWSGQIQEYAKQNNQNWILSFRKLVLKHLYRTEDFTIDSDLKNHLKSRIVSKINQLNWGDYNFKNWSDEWLGLVDLEEKNFRTIWTVKELEIISDLDNEIKRINNTDIPVLTDKCLELRTKYDEIKV